MDAWTCFEVAGDWVIHAAATGIGICWLDVCSGDEAFHASLARRFRGRDWRRDDEHTTLAAARRQFEEYFAGTRQEFDVPLDLNGTPYQQRVWAELLRIPYGETISYATLAQRTASVPRAVGQANGSNPVAIVVPCHRVVNANGKLGGYAGGIDRKRRLLELESRRLVLTAPGP